MRKHLTFANVTSLLALFIALGGTSYAVATIGTKQIKNNSVRSVDVRNGPAHQQGCEARLSGRKGDQGVGAGDGA